MIQSILNRGPPTLPHVAPAHSHHNHSNHNNDHTSSYTSTDHVLVNYSNGNNRAPSLQLPQPQQQRVEFTPNTTHYENVITPQTNNSENYSEQFTPYGMHTDGMHTAGTAGFTPSYNEDNDDAIGTSIYDYLNNAEHSLLFSDIQKNSNSNTLFIHDSPVKSNIISPAMPSNDNDQDETDPYAYDNDFEPIDCFRIKTCSEFGTHSNSPIVTTSNAANTPFISPQKSMEMSAEISLYDDVDGDVYEQSSLSLSRKLFSADVDMESGAVVPGKKSRVKQPSQQQQSVQSKNQSEKTHKKPHTPHVLATPAAVTTVSIQLPDEEEEGEGEENFLSRGEHSWEGEDEGIGLMDNYSWATGLSLWIVGCFVCFTYLKLLVAIISVPQLLKLLFCH